MLNTKITKDRVRHHFQYSVWKYVALVIGCVVGWNLIYTTTAYRTPKDKRVDVYVVGTPSFEAMEEVAALAAPAFPDMEEINFLVINMPTEDDQYGNMQLMTYVGAGEGDVYLMPRSMFQSYAASSAFMDLRAFVDDGTLQLGEDGLAQGITMDMEGVTGYYGVHAGSLYKLMDYGIDNRDMFLCVTAYSQNAQNAAKMVQWLIDNMTAEKPEWLVQYEAQQAELGAQAEATPVPSY